MNRFFSGAAGSYKLINYIFAGIIVCIFIYSGIFSPLSNNYPVQCVHERLSGVPCPSCGISHSFSYIVRGNIKEALEWNAYGPRVFLFFLFQLFLRISNNIFLMRNPQKLRQLTIFDICLSLVSVGLGFSQFVVYYVSLV